MKNKFLLVLSLVFALVFGVGFTSVSALSIPSSVDTNDISKIRSYCDDNNLYYHEVWNGNTGPNSNYIIYCYSSPSVYSTDGTKQYLQIKSSYMAYYYNYDENEKIIGKYISSHDMNSGTFLIGDTSFKPNFIYSNYDIKDSDGNVFFLKPVEPVVSKTLVKPVTVTLISQLSTLLPVGLAILSVVLVISLVRRLIPYFLG